MLRDQKVLQRRHTGEQTNVLEGSCHLGRGRDAVAGHVVQQKRTAAGMGERDRSCGRAVKSGDAVEHRRLAGAVRADDGRDVAGACLE